MTESWLCIKFPLRKGGYRGLFFSGCHPTAYCHNNTFRVPPYIRIVKSENRQTQRLKELLSFQIIIKSAIVAFTIYFYYQVKFTAIKINNIFSYGLLSHKLIAEHFSAF